MSVLLLVRLVAKPGQGGAMKDLVLPHMGDSSGIEGCSGLELLVDAGDSDQMTIIEWWTTVATHKAHLAALTAAGGMDAVLALSATDPVRTYYTQTDG